VTYHRTPGYRPSAEENQHNAWYYKSRSEGASNGRLEGKTVVLKDNVMLAGRNIARQFQRQHAIFSDDRIGFNCSHTIAFHMTCFG